MDVFVDVLGLPVRHETLGAFFRSMLLRDSVTMQSGEGEN